MDDAHPEPPPVKRNSLRLATASRALPLIAGYGLNLIATPVIVSSLGLAQFGLWALTGSLAQYGYLLDLGVSSSVTRFTALHLARDDAKAADRVMWTASVLVTSVGLPLLLIGLLGGQIFANIIGFSDAGTVRTVIGASLLILITGQLCTIITGCAYGREFQALPNTIITICGTLGTCLSTTAAALSRNVVVYAWAVAAWNTVTLLAIAIVIHSRIVRIRPTKPSWATLKELSSFGLKGQGLLIAELVIFQASKIILGVVGGTSAAGAYELGSRLALGFRALGTLFTSALTAPLTRTFSDRGIAGVRELVDRLTTRVVALSIAPPLLGLALAPTFLRLWLGDYATLTLAVMTTLCAAFTTNMLTSILAAAANAIGRPGLNTKAALMTALLGLGLGVLPLLFLGPVGLVSGTAAAIAIGSAYSIRLVQVALDSAQKRHYQLIAGPCMLGVTASLVSYASTVWLPSGNRFEAAIALTIGLLVFLCIYTFTTVLSGYLPRSYFTNPLK